MNSTLSPHFPLYENPPLRIAQVMGIMNSGGVEAVVMNYYRAVDKSQIQFDFFVDRTCSFPQREEIENLGGRFFLVPPYSHVFSYLGALIKLFRENGYTIVHAHNNTINVLPLLAAFIAGVPVRICHNHSTAHRGEGMKTVLKYLLRPLAKIFATDYFACGEKAGRWMFGDGCFQRGKVRVINNAFDTDRYAFHSADRIRLRGELGIGDHTVVVGHVGRFTYAKNHPFLLSVFQAYHLAHPDSVLLLIGEGELEAEIRETIHRLELDGFVRFLGVRKDVNLLYSAMDVFFLPSFYEGLSLVGVEAQANGLACLISKNVPSELDRTGRVYFLSLKAPVSQWADMLQQLISRRETHYDSTLPGFSIQVEALKLQSFYLQRAGREGI